MTVRLDLDFSPEHLQLIDTLRGDVPREEFLKNCMQLGLLDLQDEATRVYRDFLFPWAVNATEHFKAYRESRKIEMGRRPEAKPEANYLRRSSEAITDKKS